ncbi:uncharacterized protein EI90DRAFT_3001446 [Cantharellus anzutake]|uniref:uncharacterized protein n=1 Tax=Cantharellus anzutake TaxID=1750568 RepID=UPI001908C541|nr:uncharacterized protein EI90DRAFT_3001446 [Cantharellus anzutake]KAF8321431.1 hypothetical protein EI90DRAFT_3001446 [Cantharellus anzutake]
MASKRQRHDSTDTYTTPDTPDAAMAVVRRLVKQFDLDVPLKDDDSKHGVGIEVTYDEAAPRVGLQPWDKLDDIGTFEIHRCHIPTNLFKSIVMDMDVMLMQYGHPSTHRTEEARSRFFSPVLNHLVKQFTFILRNTPETILAGHIGTQGLIKHVFKTFGAVVVLFIEMKLLVGNDPKRLEAIAQVITECDGSNRFHHFSLPIHCIFSDGWSFEFFRFERMPNPTFLRGCFQGDPPDLRHGMRLPDIETSLPFILQLRCVCETIFDVMLSAYIAGLKAYYNREEDMGKEGLKRLSFGGWDRALQLAEHAQEAFREAEVQCKEGNIVSANVTIDAALLALQESTGALPTRYKSKLIMMDWDDAEIDSA